MTVMYGNNGSHFLTLLGADVRHLIDVLTRVAAVGHAESKVKIKSLHQLVPEEVSLYHPEVTHLLVSNSELHSVGPEPQARLPHF